MAKIEMKGLDDYTQALSRLEHGLKVEVCGAAIYEAADIVADQIREAIKALPVDAGRGGSQRLLNGPNRKQKAGLLESFGVTKMRDDVGVYNVKLGFDGYNGIRTKRWPKGQPNAMIARAVERGTSFLQKNPFLKRAVAGSKKRAIEAMQRTIDRKTKSLMN